MFYVIKSNKTENLLQSLFSVISEVPEDPISPEWICIQSRGMKQWISLKSAEYFGIAANFQFFFLRSLINRILDHFIATEKSIINFESGLKANPEINLDKDYILWAVIKHIRQNRSQKALEGINAYIQDDTGKKLFQVSGQIARLFDDYQLYRPELLMAWQKGLYEQNSPLALSNNSTAEWQAFLWQKIAASCPEAHLACRATTFLKTFSEKNFNKEGMTDRICLFGISGLPELFLKIFEKVSSVMDIYLFLLSPSDQFFFDLKPEREIEKIALKAYEKKQGEIPAIQVLQNPQNLYYESGNPLLSSLGTSCQIFHAILEDINYQEPFYDLFSDPLEDSSTLPTILSVLQSDILNLRKRSGNSESCNEESETGKGTKQVEIEKPFEIEFSDNSVEIHSCHSPMREAQVLKDLLLRELEKDKDLFPHDIIVMMPDIEAYAPFIESVFSLENDLPFSVSDRRRRSESEPLEAFLKILALRDSRLEKSVVLDLLLSESIALKFGISRDDVEKIGQMVEDAGILWGRDQAHREAMGFPFFSENTWEFGLNRLFMGMAMPEQYDDLVEDVLPCESSEGTDLEILGKLAGFTQTLFSCLTALEGEKTVADWCALLRHIVFSLLEKRPETAGDLSFLLENIEEMELGERGAMSEEVKEGSWENSYGVDLFCFEIIHALIKEKLDLNISHGNFMSGVITFCNIMPMRSIPFKIVVLMGMDEKSFPGTDFSRAFDLIRQYPRPGDKNKRQEDRYLFLETILSAREKLIITYTGQSMADNSPLPPSGVVSELKEFIKESFIFPKGTDFYYEHPLHPFDAVYFDSSSVFFSYSANYCRMAQNLMSGKVQKKAFILKKEDYKSIEPVNDIDPDITSSIKPMDIALEDLIRFFRHPVQAFFREGLNMSLSSPEEIVDDREAFAIKGLEHYMLGKRILVKQAKLAKSFRSDEDFSEEIQNKDLYSVLKAGGFLPPGKKGKLEYENLLAEAAPFIKEARNIESKAKMSVLRGRIMLNNFCITGQLTDIREDGLYFINFGRLNGTRLLSAWINHLFLNAAGTEGYPKQTFVIGRDPDDKKPLLQVSFSASGEKTKILLEDLCKIYQKGLLEPFCFFPETSYQLAKVLAQAKFDLSRDSLLKAMNRIKKYWFDGFRGTGEKQNRYTELFAERNDPFESFEDFVDSGFVENTLRIFQAMLES